MTEPMTDERLAEIEATAARWAEGDLKNPTTASVFRHRAELLAEVKRLKAHLAEFIGWEPTVKEEYDHACAVAERAEDVVKAFDTGPKLEVNAFVADLRRALEMQ